MEEGENDVFLALAQTTSTPVSQSARHKMRVDQRTESTEDILDVPQSQKRTVLATRFLENCKRSSSEEEDEKTANNTADTDAAADDSAVVDSKSDSGVAVPKDEDKENRDLSVVMDSFTEMSMNETGAKSHSKVAEYDREKDRSRSLLSSPGSSSFVAPPLPLRERLLRQRTSTSAATPVVAQSDSEELEEEQADDLQQSVVDDEAEEVGDDELKEEEQKAAATTMADGDESVDDYVEKSSESSSDGASDSSYEESPAGKKRSPKKGAQQPPKETTEQPRRRRAYIRSSSSSSGEDSVVESHGRRPKTKLNEANQRQRTEIKATEKEIRLSSDDFSVDLDDSTERQNEEQGQEEDVVTVPDSDEEENAIAKKITTDNRKMPLLLPSFFPPKERDTPTEQQRMGELRRKISSLEAAQNQTDRMKLPDQGVKLNSRIQLLRDELLALEMSQDGQPLHVPMPKRETFAGDVIGERLGLSSQVSNYRKLFDLAPTDDDATQRQRVHFGAEDIERLVAPRPVAKRMADYNRMGYEKQREQARVTEESLRDMHSAIHNCPPETDEKDDPRYLRVPLMPHQRQALSWLLHREQQKPPGGILADDMGLGKTLTMISLVLYKKYPPLGENAEEQRNREKMEQKIKSACEEQQLVRSRTTLVVCPASLLLQWEKEIQDRVGAGRLKVHVFHGPKNKRETNARRLAGYDVVITTYALIASEIGEGRKLGAKEANYRGSDDDDDESSDDQQQAGPTNRFGQKKKKRSPRKKAKRNDSILLQLLWERVILDEAHQIKNHKSITSRSCCRLQTFSRWCLSGTPIHNSLLDFYSLVKFLRVQPWDDLGTYKEFIMERNSRQAAERLNALVKSLLLRRTKEQNCPVTGKRILELKPKTYSEELLELSAIERKVYDRLFSASQLQVKELVKTEDQKMFELQSVTSGAAKQQDFGYKNPFILKSQQPRDDRTAVQNNFANMSCILVLLLRLRQSCVHFALTKQAVDIEALLDLETKSEANMDVDEQVAQQTDRMLNMSMDEAAVDVGASVEELFQESGPSTKVMAVIDAIERVRSAEKPEKCVIVSQWTSLLEILRKNLKARRISFTRICGDIPTKDRQERVDKFNKEDGGPVVMLLSLTAGGVGLNLVGGNHLFLVDLHWNPQLEQQACDRIYRMGQEKSVFIHKFICKDTIEERVQEIQNRKLELAKGVLEGTSKKGMNKLSINEIKHLFGLDKESQRAAAARNAAAQPPNGTVATAPQVHGRFDQ